MEKLVEKIQQILNVFLQEELGNRVSQFSIKGLRDTIINEIKNYKPIDKMAENIPAKSLKSINKDDVGKLTSGIIKKESK